MPNHKSAEKRVRQTAKRRDRNRSHRSALRSQLKKFRVAVAEGDSKPEELQKLFVECQVVVDKSIARGIIHRNKAARVKARMASAMAKATAKA